MLSQAAVKDKATRLILRRLLHILLLHMLDYEEVRSAASPPAITNGERQRELTQSSYCTVLTLQFGVGSAIA